MAAPGAVGADPACGAQLRRDRLQRLQSERCAAIVPAASTFAFLSRRVYHWRVIFQHVIWIAIHCIFSSLHRGTHLVARYHRGHWGTPSECLDSDSTRQPAGGETDMRHLLLAILMLVPAQ